MSHIIRSRTALLVLTTVAMVTMGSFAFASSSAPKGPVHACAAKKTGALRLADTCRRSERPVTFGARGPAGPAGKTGPKGSAAPTTPPAHTTQIGTLTLTAQSTPIPVFGYTFGANVSTASAGSGGGSMTVSNHPLTTWVDASQAASLFGLLARGTTLASTTLTLSDGHVLSLKAAMLSELTVDSTVSAAAGRPIDRLAMTWDTATYTSRAGVAPTSPASVGSLALTLPGASTATTYPISALSWTSTQSAVVGSGSGAGTGKANVGAITVTRTADADSPALFNTLITGRHLASVSITAGGTTYLLTDVVLSAIDTENTATGANAPSLERITISFAKIAVTSGGVTTAWNLVTNAGA